MLRLSFKLFPHSNIFHYIQPRFYQYHYCGNRIIPIFALFSYNLYMKYLNIFITLFTLIFFFIAVPVKAEGSSFSISPNTIELSHSKTSSEIILKNNTTFPQSLSVSFIPIKPSNDTATNAVLPAELTPEYTQFFRIVRISDVTQNITKVLLQAQETKILKISVEPKTLQSKEYLFAVLFTTQPTVESNNSRSLLRTSLGVNVFASFQQPIHKQPSLTISSPSFLLSGPLTVDVTVQNNSNVLIHLDGKIEIQNIFGKTIYSSHMNNQRVFGGKEKLIYSAVQGERNALQKNSLLGIYTIKANILAEDGLSQEVKRHVIAVPTISLALITIVIIFISGICLRIFKKI